MHTTITLTHRDITVTITLHNQCYGTDRFGFGYSRSRQGFWHEHGSGDLWQEVSRIDMAALEEAA